MSTDFAFGDHFMRAAATTYPLVGKLVMGTSRLLNFSVLAKADLVTFDDQ
jgi:hypothetical protein